MESLVSILRLGLGGLLLDQPVYRAQRDAPGGLQRGFLLVILIGLLVGLASWVGDIGEFLTSPSPADLVQTLYEGLTTLPIYRDLVEQSPELGAAIEQSFAQQTGGLMGSGPLGGALTVLTTPLIFLLRWLLVGSLAHIAARAFGGGATFGQTLACTALASGASLLGVVQVVPYAQVAATTILGLLGTYVAVREAHGLPPGRTFAAVAIGPLLLLVLVGGLFCCLIFFVVSAIGGALQGAAR